MTWVSITPPPPIHHFNYIPLLIEPSHMTIALGTINFNIFFFIAYEHTEQQEKYNFAYKCNQYTRLQIKK